MNDYEKLGAFYLGKEVDEAGEMTDSMVLYDAKDLNTHAMCVGMTGSGKTGLCLSLLEEAAIDGIPAIMIDPKGDLGNLLLSFPDLDAKSFEPWIDEEDAKRRGKSVGDRAGEVASMWKSGLADWGQDGARIKRFRDAVDLSIYTPGSNMGLPLSIMGSFAAPSDAILDDSEVMRERISSAVSGLLGLAGVDADPMQSPEHIFLSNVLDFVWRDGKDVSLADLVRYTLKPPISQVGVMDLDSFFPEKARQKLAMRINGLIASPGFSAWTEGEPLNIESLLRTEAGKPRLSIISIAHLNDEERMFFVTLLLSEMVTWMRSQSGTTALRAILYMDEVLGFLPPVANPPSKAPMLTLLKQARAFGLGCVLATQNPVDIDYKALSNCGTWFLGRLQTERDVARVLDGLKGASAAAGKTLDVDALKATLGGLKSRVFLMNNVHEDAPVLFHTRWVLSYLRGPLTRKQIKLLMDDRKAQPSDATAPMGAPKSERGSEAAETRMSESSKATAPAAERPVVPEDIKEVFIGSPSGKFRYQPGFLATIRLHYALARANVDTWWEPTLLVAIDEDLATLWDSANVYERSSLTIEDDPWQEDVPFLEVPRGALTKSKLKSAKASLKRALYQQHAITIGYCRQYKMYSTLKETRASFVGRVAQAHREARDAAVEKMRDKEWKKLDKLEEKIRKGEQKLEREKQQASANNLDTAVTVGASIFGAMFGRKRIATGVKQAARRAGRSAKERGDVTRAQSDVTALQEQLIEDNEALERELEDLKLQFVEAPLIEEVTIRPKKTEIDVVEFQVAWVPISE